MGASSVLSTPRAMRGYLVLDETRIIANDLYDTLSPSTVVIGYVHPGIGNVHERFAFSMAQQCANMGQRILSILSVTSPWQIDSRNALIEGVLDMDPLPDYLLWWDTDMQVPERALRDLIETVEANDAKVGTIFGLMQRIGFREGQEWTPVANAYWRQGTDNYYIRSILPSYTEPFWCEGTGLGFTLIATSVFEDFPEEHLPWHVVEEGGMGHDIRFFHHADEPVIYDPTIRSIHWKQLPLDFNLYMRANNVATEEDMIELSKLQVDIPGPA